MTATEYREEHRLVYETRLGILGVLGTPTADQHNMALIEADEHIAAIKRQERLDGAKCLTDLKNSL